MKSFKKFITEGGAFGHLSNIFDIDYSKKQLIDIINNSIDLKFDYPEIKTDAINLMVSVINGRVMAARNKGHLKNFGENSMTITDVADKFKGRDVGTAYVRAIQDFQSAVNKLSKAQVDKIFANGKKWMSMEVMGHGGSNIIEYHGIEELRLHGTIEHDENGIAVSQVNKADAKVMDGMLRQRGAEKGKFFTIKKLTPAQFNPIKNADKYKAKLVKQLNSVLGSNAGISDYKRNALLSQVKKHTKDKEVIDTVMKRWFNGDKSVKITAIYKKHPNDKAWIQKMDKSIGPIMKEVMLPLEYIFLELGSLVVGSLNVFMSLSPKKTTADLKSQLNSAISLINAKGDDKLKAKLSLELKRLEKAGGLKAVAPEEGITFFVGDDFVKLTGTFAPLNQIIGLTFRV